RLSLQLAVPPVPAASPLRALMRSRGFRLALALASLSLVVIQAEPLGDARGDEMSSLERAIAADPENLRVAADYRQLVIAATAFDRSIDFLGNLANKKVTGPNVHISLALAYVDKVPTSGDIRRLYLGRDAMGELTKAI